MKTLANVKEVSRNHLGHYIRLDGCGVMSGLAGPPTKATCYKIVAVMEFELHLKAYRARYSCTLPSHNFDQKAEVYTPAEYKGMPIY